MKKLLLALAALSVFACKQTESTEPATAQQASAASQTVKADTPQRLAQLPRTVIDYDRSLLNAEEQQVVAKLIEASQHIDEIFWLQVSEENPQLRAKLQQNAGASDLDRAGYEYFLANKGKWDRLKGEEPFIAPFDKKPEGAAFYPADITKEEF